MLDVKELCRITIIDNFLGHLVTLIGGQAKVDRANVNYGGVANFTFIVAQCALEGLYLKMEKLVSLDEGVGGEGPLTALEVADKLSRDNLVLRMSDVSAKMLNHHFTVARLDATVPAMVTGKTAHLVSQIKVISKVRVGSIAQFTVFTLPGCQPTVSQHNVLLQENSRKRQIRIS